MSFAPYWTTLQSEFSEFCHVKKVPRQKNSSALPLCDNRKVKQDILNSNNVIKEIKSLRNKIPFKALDLLVVSRNFLTRKRY